MKYLAHRHCKIAFGFKVLRHGCVVPRMVPPVGLEVINSGCVWPAAGQHGGPTGGTHRLLRSKNILKQLFSASLKH